MENNKPENGNKNTKEREVKDTWGSAFVIFLRLSNWIVWPVLFAVIIGNWLDNKYGKEPWLLLLSVGISFIVSMIGLTINALKEIKKQEKSNDRDNRKSK